MTRGDDIGGEMPDAGPHGYRFGWPDAAVLIGLVLFACHPVEGLRPAIAAGGVLLLLVALAGPRPATAPVAALVGLFCIYAASFRFLFVWPAYLLLPLFTAFAAALVRSSAGEFRAGLSIGRVGRGEAGLIVIISAAAAVALIGWVWWFAPDLARFRQQIPSWPTWALAGAGLGFSVINAVLEEIIWRGLLQQWLMKFCGPVTALLLQAVSFGAAHYSGFPGGIAGVALASLYGLMLGALVMYSRGLAAAILAHIAADAVIFSLVLVWAVPG